MTGIIRFCKPFVNTFRGVSCKYFCGVKNQWVRCEAEGQNRRRGLDIEKTEVVESLRGLVLVGKRGRVLELPYVLRPRSWYNEAELRSIAYNRLCQHFGNAHVKCELRVKSIDGRKRGARLDLAILDSSDRNRIRLAIELKKSPLSVARAQAQRYREELGIPTLTVRGFDEARNVIELVEAELLRIEGTPA